MNLDSDTFDVVVLGTGLAQSIAAAAVAKAGKSVLHLDPNEYYGGEQASLTLDELEQWASERSSSSSSSSLSPFEQSQRLQYTNASTTPLTPELQADRRRYALSLFPALMASRGDLVQTLISSDVSKYVSFKLLDGVHISTCGSDGSADFARVPGSKEDVFKDKTISLPEKRKLMKALLFAGGEFEDDPLLQGREGEPLLAFLQSAFGLSARLAEALTYALAFADADEACLPALKRARRYLRSMGRYGPSAFLVGQYGGAGEVAQGFCRACAVFGGTYILGAEGAPSSIEVGESSVKLSIGAHSSGPVTAKHLVTPPGFLPADSAAKEVRTTAHLIAVVTSQPPVLHKSTTSEDEEVEDDDTAVFAFPPTSASPLVRALVMGEGTGSCPRGQWIVYLSAESSDGDPKALLEPFLSRVAPEGAAFVAAYLQHREVFSEPKAAGAVDNEEAGGEVAAGDADEAREAHAGPPLVLLRPYSDAHTLTEGLDHEAREAARAFAQVCSEEFFPRAEEEMEDDDE